MTSKNDKSKATSHRKKEPKGEAGIKAYKSLIRDFPMPPSSNTGARSKILLNKSKNNKSSNTRKEKTDISSPGHKTKASK